jgi:cell division control protein 45
MVLKNVRLQDSYLERMLEEIRQNPASLQAVTVHILAAADHDGVCSSYMLQALLCRGCADVKYLTLPVTCNAEVMHHISELHSDEYEDVRSVILLNCGGSIDIAKGLQEHKVPDHITCYIVDSHRPYNLSNVYESQSRVVVVDDDPANDGNLIPEALASEDEESEDDELEKDDPAAQSFEDRLDAKRRRLDREENQRQRREEKLERKIGKMEAQQKYYSGTYYATPVALSLYKMSMKDGMLSQDMLWLAAMSLAGYHDCGFISDMVYDQMAWEELKEALDRFGDPNLSQGSAGSQGRSSVDDFLAGAGTSNRAGNLEIRFEKALALTLYKHWTLEQAMHHTPRIFGTLELQWDKGSRTLLSFFASAGIEPKQFRQMFSGMSLDVRKTLHKRVRQHGLQYGIDEKVFWPQFFRDIGQIGDTASALYLNELSASDGAHVINSILTDIPFRLSSSQIESLPTREDGTVDMNDVQEMERKALIENFGRAGERCFILFAIIMTC